MKSSFRLIIILAILTSCAGGSEKKASEVSGKADNDIIRFTDQQIKFADIQTEQIKKREIADEVACKGTVKASADNKAKVSAPMEGYVKNILVDYNEFVKVNTPLVTLRHSSYIELQKQYLQVKNRLAYMEKEYQRQKTLQESKASAAKEFQKTESEYKNLKAERTALGKQLDLINITPDAIDEDNIINTITVFSPIQGFVNNINVSIGQYITPEKVMIDMLNRENFKINLQVYEKDIHKIQEGQKVLFSCSDPDSKGEVNKAKVISIGQQVNEETKTFNVYAKPITCYRNLRDGLFINANIRTQSDSAWVLPGNAVVQGPDETYVFISTENNTFRKQEIETGKSEQDYIEIKDHQQLEELDIVVN